MHRKYGSRLWGIKSQDDILPPEHIDPELILRHAEKMELAHHMAAVNINLMKAGRLVLTYEQINKDLLGTIKTIEEYLQVPLVAETQFVKATPDSVKDALSNYAEVCKFFADTRFSKYILFDD